MDADFEIISIHSVYALYEIENGGIVDAPALIFERPSDWGNAQRWHYHWCRIEFLFDNNVIAGVPTLNEVGWGGIARR